MKITVLGSGAWGTALALLLGAWLLLNQAEPGVAGFFKGVFSSGVTLPIALMG